MFWEPPEQDLGGATKVVRGPKCVAVKITGAAQHVENTSNTPHVVGQACQGWSKQSKVGPKLGVPKLLREAPAGGQSWPKSQSLRLGGQSLGNLQNLNFCVKMSMQPRLFLHGMTKQNKQNMCFHLGPVLCTCGF